MQRLWSSCIRSRSLIYASPRSFLRSPRFNFSSPSKVLSQQELNNKAIDTVTEHASSPSVLSPELANKAIETESASSPPQVLSPEFNKKAIDIAERASATEDFSPDAKWNEISNRTMEDLRPPLNAYSGRTVLSTRTRDLVGVFKTLENILSRNKIRSYLKSIERHEKKGQKRRRLESERWRKQFANEVREKVKLVAKIRKRGA